MSWANESSGGVVVFNEKLDFTPDVAKFDRESSSFDVILSGFLRRSKTFEMYDKLSKKENLDCKLIPFELQADGSAGVRQQLIELLLALKTNEKFRSIMVSDPYKQQVQDIVDVIDPRAAKCGAINVILKRDGITIGDNFDGDAFFDGATSELDFDFHGKSMVMFGCGGVSSAVAVRLANLVSKLAVVDLDSSRVDDLVNRVVEQNPDLEIERVSAHGARDFKEFDILYNGTGLGKFDLSASPLHDGDRLPGAAVAFDANYTPDSTAFLQTLAQAGCLTHNGLSHMLCCTSMHLSAVSGSVVSYGTVKAVYRLGCVPG